MSKIAVFLAEGFEEIEALAVVDICRRANIDTDMVSMGEEYQVKGAHEITVTADKLFGQVDFDGLDMLVLPGGMPGTKNLEAHQGLPEKIKEFHRKGKLIAAICAAPSILGHLGMLEGRRACSYPSFESHLKGASVVQEEVVVSDHIITARGMGCAVSFGLAIAAVFVGQEAAEKLSAEMIYRV